MSSNVSKHNNTRKRQHAPSAWNPEFQPLFDVLRSGFGYKKGEQCRDEHKDTYVEEVLKSERLEATGTMTTHKRCNLVRTAIIQKIKNFENTEGISKEEKKFATEVREKVEQKLEEIAQSLKFCCSQKNHSFALNEISCAGDNSCRIAPEAGYYPNQKEVLCVAHYQKKLETVRENEKQMNKMRKEYGELQYHDKYPKEEAIKCKQCKRVVHKICELYNPLIDLPEAYYVCRLCGGKPRRNLSVKNLQIIASSQAIEAELNTHMREKGLTRDLSFRALCCEDRDGEIPEEEAEHCPNLQKLISRDCAHRFKMYGLFDFIGGKDVLIAVLAVDEYRESSILKSKQGVASIQYFDTAKYFEPRRLSRELNQSLLRIYSDHVRKQGFKKILVYASPPATPGSDYLINSPPLVKANLNQKDLHSYYHETFNGLRKTLKSHGIHAVVGYTPGLEDKEDSMKFLCQKLYVDSGFWAAHLEKFLAENKENVGIKKLQTFIKNTSSSYKWSHIYMTFKPTGSLKCDADPIIESALAHSRVSFLDTQVHEKWQFNTLRRATYSTMMIISTLLKERNQL